MLGASKELWMRRMLPGACQKQRIYWAGSALVATRAALRSETRDSHVSIRSVSPRHFFFVWREFFFWGPF